MADESGSLNAQPTGDTVRYLIIVARHRPDLWHALMRQFAGERRVQVLRDRRRLERRQRVQTREPDRRGRDRRRPPSLDTDLPHRSFLIVAQLQGVIEGGRQDPLGGQRSGRLDPQSITLAKGGATKRNAPLRSREFTGPVWAWIQRHEGHAVVRLQGEAEGNHVPLFLACLDCRCSLAYDRLLR